MQVKFKERGAIWRRRHREPEPMGRATGRLVCDEGTALFPDWWPQKLMQPKMIHSPCSLLREWAVVNPEK